MGSICWAGFDGKKTHAGMRVGDKDLRGREAVSQGSGARSDKRVTALDLPPPDQKQESLP